MLSSRVFALSLLLGSAIYPKAASSQASVRPMAVLETLNKEAAAADTPEGLKDYSQHLIQMLVGDQLGTAYVTSLSDRLARAELMARHGKRKLISEDEVAQSFNSLMKQVVAPQSLMANERTVHQFRIALQATSPALTAVDKNESHCNPSEAVFLLVLLLTNNGTLPEHLPSAIKPEDLPRQVLSVHDAPDARTLIFFYSSQHPRIESVKMFDHAIQIFGF